MRCLLPLILSFACLACGRVEPRSADTEDAGEARRTVARAIDRIGSLDELAAQGPLVMAATGTLDKNAEGQSFTPGRSAPAVYRERIAFDFANQRFARESREDRYDGTFEWLRVIDTPDQPRRWVVFALGIAAAETVTENQRARALRRLPHALLDELAHDSVELRWLGRDDGVERIVATIDGTDFTIDFNEHGEPRQLRYDASLPGRGPTSIVWSWSDWRQLEGRGRFPYRYAVAVGDRAWLELFVDSITAAQDDSPFAIPAGVRSLPPRDEAAHTEPDGHDGHALPPVELQPVARGVFTAPGVRGGFAPLVVAFDSFTVAVDAPASFPLLNDIPATETDPGPYPGWVGDRFVDAIHRQLPDRPIRYLVLTHAHEDHIGGVRAFIAAGATVLAPASARGAVERIAALPASAMRDRLARSGGPLRFEPIDSTRSIGDHTRSVRLLPIAPNPHHDGLLAVLVEDVDLLFVSDLITPAPLENYPRPDHAALDLAFLRWLDALNLQPATILAMHGSGPLTPDHLAKLRALAAASAEVAATGRQP